MCSLSLNKMASGVGVDTEEDVTSNVLCVSMMCCVSSNVDIAERERVHFIWSSVLIDFCLKVRKQGYICVLNEALLLWGMYWKTDKQYSVVISPSLIV